MNRFYLKLVLPHYLQLELQTQHCPPQLLPASVTLKNISVWPRNSRKMKKLVKQLPASQSLVHSLQQELCSQSGLLLLLPKHKVQNFYFLQSCYADHCSEIKIKLK